MSKIKRVLILLLLLSVTFFMKPSFAINIGIVVDGDSTFYSDLIDLYQKEILELTQGEFNIEFNQQHIKKSRWSYKSIKRDYNALQSDESVDIVLTLGSVSSLVAAYDKSPRKPVFAPYVIDANFPGLPRDGNASGVANLNYLAEAIAIEKDLELFRSVAEFDNLSILVDSSIYQAVKNLSQRIELLGKKVGVNVNFILANNDLNALIDSIPKETEAVIITVLPRFDNNKMDALLAELKTRKLPSYSVVDPGLVDRGALMATRSPSDDKQRARRTALNIQSVLLGEEPAFFPVLFTPNERLVINMQTAREIDLSPRFDFLSQAILLNQKEPGIEPEYRLEDVAKEAIKANLQLISNRLSVLAGEENVKIARSALFPQISLSASSLTRSTSTSTVKNGLAASKSTSGQISLDQVIFSETTNSNFDIEKFNQQSLIAGQRELELDIVEQATIAFLTILNNQTRLNVSQNQLKLSLANLTLAQNKLEIGSANAADVYRWESQIATDRQSLLQSQADLNQAHENLNNILNRPIGYRYKTQPTTLEQGDIILNKGGLEKVITNYKSFNLFRDLYIKIAHESSPELARQRANIEAARRQVKANKRIYYLPEVSLSGSTSRIVDEQRRQGTSQEDESDWQLSLNVSLPLFQGGQRPANLRSSNLDLEQNMIQYDILKRQLEQNVRLYFHEINASFPSIKLSKNAAESADKNLELIRDSYAQGTVSIADLIDAQNSALQAQQNSASAVYNYLIDLMNLQRQVGSFVFFLDDELIDQRIDSIKQYILNEGG